MLFGGYLLCVLACLFVFGVVVFVVRLFVVVCVCVFAGVFVFVFWIRLFVPLLAYVFCVHWHGCV